MTQTLWRNVLHKVIVALGFMALLAVITGTASMNGQQLISLK